MSLFGGRSNLLLRPLYNFRELSAELEIGGHTFHTHSDTEVLFASTDLVAKINDPFKESGIDE